MSPAQHPFGQPNAFASSNSTANQFLGTSRKPWMTTTAPTLPTRSAPNKPSFPKLNTANSPKKPAPQKPPDSGSSTSMPTPARLGSNSSPPTSIRAPVQKTVTLPPQAAPVSPSTPRGTQPESVREPTATVATNSIVTLPSPEPSNASHASPVIVVEKRHPASALLSKDIPSTNETHAVSAPPAPAPSAPAPSPPKAVSPTANGKNKSATIRVPFLGTFNTPANVQTQLNPPPPTRFQPQSQRQPQPQAASSPSVSIWKLAKDELISYLALSRSRNLSDAVELPRARILQDVCSMEDMFYLALHQTYCLSSYSPNHMQQVLKYGIRPDCGFDVVAQLLVDNRRLSADFVKWSVEYPLPLEAMLKVEGYTLALTQVSYCLNMIARHWSAFENDIRSRGHPPQVDELVVRLGIVSPVFQTIAFTAVTRRLFGHRDELFRACMSLFEDDQRTYKQRCASSASARHQWVFAYFEKYRQLCTTHGVLPQQPAVHMHHDGRLPSGQLPTTTSLSTQQIQHTPSAKNNNNNNNRPPLLNDPPNIHPVDTYTPSSNHPPNHHTSEAGRGQQLSLMLQQQQMFSMRAAPSNQQAQTRPHMAPPSQPSPHPPPPQTLPAITYQGTATVLTTGPNQIPPPNFQPPPHMRDAPNGVPISTSAPATGGNVNVGPVHHSPRQLPRTLFPTAQTSPHIAGQGQQPTYSQPFSQPVAHPGMVNVAQPTTIPVRPSSRHQAQQPAPTNPPAVPMQLDSVSPIALRHFLPPGFHQAVAQPALPQPVTQPVTHSSTTEQSPGIIMYFSEFAIPIQKLPPNRSAFSWKFTVSREMLSRRSRLIPQENGRGYMPVLADGDVSYRLRCVGYQGRLDLDSLLAWSQAENQWPDVVYVHVNNKEIHRTQNSKQLPLPINTHLKDGVNDLRMNILHTSQQRKKNITYAVAVEIVQVKSPGSFKSLIKTLPAPESRKQIQNRLSLSNNNDDDDLKIMGDFVSIDMRDPFTARIFEVPVRGLLCTHRECFDLSTFLQTLSTKPSAAKRATYVRCPICRQDARPSLLVVDEFLVEVRAALAQQQKLESTKALRVKSDGSWEAVMELESDTRISSSRKRDRASFEADLFKNEEASPSKTAAAPEIIELD